MKLRMIALGVVMGTVLFANSVSAQVRKVPAAVTEAFKSKYPSAANVEWSDKLTSFMARYEEDNITYEARFNSKGEWLNTERQLPAEDLPTGVIEGYEKSKYAEWEMGTVHKIMLPGDKIQYRVQAIKSDIQRKNLLFSSEGRLLKDNITL
ncbi:MAG: PepSY-like domain-containing protein [Chitinophagaceae bacterium]